MASTPASPPSPTLNYSRPLPSLPPSHQLSPSPSSSSSSPTDLIDLGVFLDGMDLASGGDGVAWRAPLSQSRARFPFPQVVVHQIAPRRRTSPSSSRRQSRSSVLLANSRPQSYSYSAPSSPSIDYTAVEDRPSHPEPCSPPSGGKFDERRGSLALIDNRYAWEMGREHGLMEQGKWGDSSAQMERRWSSAMLLEPGEVALGVFEVMGIAL